MIITEISDSDFDNFWPTFTAIVGARESYAFDPGLSYEQAKALWVDAPLGTYVAKDENGVLGSYYLKPNASGPGAHICNCGYMVAAAARGRGVARAMCLHSQDVAIKCGFTAMQFNCVVSTNEVAINLWKKLGFQVIGTIPNAYDHGRLGMVDAFIMYKDLMAGL